MDDSHYLNIDIKKSLLSTHETHLVLITINIQGNRTPDYEICTGNKGGRNIKTRQMLEENEMKVLRKIVGKTKIDRIRSQQIRKF